ncbi:cilia- and flagella-associated protein 68 isoform X1 [Anolis carolinensis]|uniref:cilia- and flagella-associated protein 68 isoform X1 n=2 Tax=Anolis carolinensis TaxID=28377 RepID=UPI002F2B7D3A
MDESSSSYTSTSDSETMSFSCFYNPLHGCLLHANGHGEVWTDWNSTAKFFQYGWRCTTNEDSYNNKTLLGNWNEERYDVRKVLQAKPMPSQYAHCFESTYSTDYSKETPHSTRRVMREPHWFPGHQPELEPPPIKRTARSCYMMAYDDPHSKESRHLDEKLLRKPEETTQKQ